MTAESMEKSRYDSDFSAFVETAARMSGAVSNPATGEGSTMDKSTYATPNAGTYLSRGQIRGLLSNSWLFQQVVTLAPEHCVLGGIELSFSDDRLEGDVKAELDALRVMQIFQECHCTARAFGGAAGFLLIDDGSSGEIDHSKPLYKKNALTRIKELKGIYMIEGGQGGPLMPAQLGPEWAGSKAQLLEREPGPDFAKPVWWEWNPTADNVGGEQLDQGVLVHRDRLIFFPGAFTDKQTRQDRGGWDLSVLNAGIKALLNYESSQTTLVNIMYDFFTVIAKIKDFKKIVTSGQLSKLVERMQADMVFQSLLHMRVCDAVDEEITKVASPVGGLDDLVDKLMDNVAGAFRTPRSLLFREASKTGGGDDVGQEYWHLDINTARERYYAPGLRKVIEILHAAEIRPATEKKFMIGFKPLKQPTVKERAEAARTYAHADEINIKDGIYSRKEARARHTAVGGLSELKLEGDEPPDLEEVKKLSELANPGKERMAGENTETKGKVPNSAAKNRSSQPGKDMD